MANRDRSKHQKTTLSPRDRVLAKEVGQAAAQEVAHEVIVAQLESQHFSGPLPPPEVLLQYEQAFPGSAERIIASFERQSDHRQSLERFHLQNDVYRAWGGLAAGLVLGLVGTVAGAYVAATATLSAQAAAGATIAGGSLASLVWCFIKGTDSRRQERERKAESVPAPSQSPSR